MFVLDTNEHIKLAVAKLLWWEIRHHIGCQQDVRSFRHVQKMLINLVHAENVIVACSPNSNR